MNFIDKLKRVKLNTFTIMCVITATFIILPLVMKIPFVSDFIAWLMSALRYQEYKSAYLGLIGGLVGSWLAITGAIYTQQKFDTEKKLEDDLTERLEEQEKADKAYIMCKEFLFNEIRRNHKAILVADGGFLNSIKNGASNWNYDGKGKYSLNNWFAIREKVLNDNFECARKLMKLYQYYEFLFDFAGTAKEAGDVSRLDFSVYMDIYNDVMEYFEMGE